MTTVTAFPTSIVIHISGCMLVDFYFSSYFLCCMFVFVGQFYQLFTSLKGMWVNCWSKEAAQLQVAILVSVL
jgi:hypothetical protein